MLLSFPFYQFPLNDVSWNEFAVQLLQHCSPLLSLYPLFLLQNIFWLLLFRAGLQYKQMLVI